MMEVDHRDSMQDTSDPQSVVDTLIGLRFALASCLVQLIAPPVGMMMFDLAYCPNSGVTLVAYFTGILRIIPYSWKLAVEPLAIAVVLAMCFSTMTSRRYWFTMIAALTLLNILVSGMFIVARSL